MVQDKISTVYRVITGNKHKVEKWRFLWPGNIVLTNFVVQIYLLPQNEYLVYKFIFMYIILWLQRNPSCGIKLGSFKNPIYIKALT